MEPRPDQYRCRATVQSRLCINPGFLTAVPNQCDLMRSDLCRMSTAIVPGAISVITKRWSQRQSGENCSLNTNECHKI